MLKTNVSHCKRREWPVKECVWFCASVKHDGLQAPRSLSSRGVKQLRKQILGQVVSLPFTVLTTVWHSVYSVSAFSMMTGTDQSVSVGLIWSVAASHLQHQYLLLCFLQLLFSRVQRAIQAAFLSRQPHAAFLSLQLLTFNLMKDAFVDV